MPSMPQARPLAGYGLLRAPRALVLVGAPPGDERQDRHRVGARERLAVEASGHRVDCVPGREEEGDHAATAAALIARVTSRLVAALVGRPTATGVAVAVRTRAYAA